MLESHRGGLRLITLAAFVMQTVLLFIPLTFHHSLPHLLAPADTATSHRSSTLGLLIAVIVGVGCVRAFANYQFLRLAGKVGHGLVADLRFRRLLPHAATSGQVRGSTRSGRAPSVHWRCRRTESLVQQGGSQTHRGRTDGGAVYAGLVWLNWQLALLLIPPLGLLLALLWRLSHPVREATRQSRREQSRLTGRIEFALNHLRETKIADARASEPNIIDAGIREVAARNAERDRLAAILESASQLVLFAILPALLLAGFSLVWSQRMSANDLVAFVWLLLHLLVLLRGSLPAFVLHQKALVSAQRLYLLLSRSAEKGRGSRRVKSRFRELTIGQGENCFVFSRGGHVWPSEIDLDTSWDVLLGFARSGGMRLLIDGVPIEQVDVKLRRRRIGRWPVDGECVEESAGPTGDASPSDTRGLRIVLIDNRSDGLGPWSDKSSEWPSSAIVFLAVEPTIDANRPSRSGARKTVGNDMLTRSFGP
ncbi:MAG: ABC transporter transmembrane domain-containing protein [Pirellulaceae bacterium]